MIDVGAGYRLLLPTEEPKLGDQRHYWTSRTEPHWIDVIDWDLSPVGRWRSIPAVRDEDDYDHSIQYRIFRRKLESK